jgi:hypothetical protein
VFRAGGCRSGIEPSAFTEGESVRRAVAEMKAVFSDAIRVEYSGYAEPLLLTAAEHQGKKLKISRSKYIRYAIIRALIADGYPLDKMSSKFNKFYQSISQSV